MPYPVGKIIADIQVTGQGAPCFRQPQMQRKVKVRLGEIPVCGDLFQKKLICRSRDMIPDIDAVKKR